MWSSPAAASASIQRSFAGGRHRLRHCLQAVAGADLDDRHVGARHVLDAGSWVMLAAQR